MKPPRSQRRSKPRSARWGRDAGSPAPPRRRSFLLRIVLWLVVALVVIAAGLAWLGVRQAGNPWLESERPDLVEDGAGPAGPPEDADPAQDIGEAAEEPDEGADGGIDIAAPEDEAEPPQNDDAPPEEGDLATPEPEDTPPEEGDLATPGPEGTPPADEEKPEALATAHRDAVVWLGVAPDGALALSASTDKFIKVWSVAEARLLRDLGSHADMARAALFHPDGVTALSAGDDGDIVRWRLADGAVIDRFSLPDFGSVRGLALSPDGRYAVGGHQNGRLSVWDLERSRLLTQLHGHDWPVSAVAVSPDGTRIASGSIDGSLRLWSLPGGALLRSVAAHELGIYGISYLPDGSGFITASGDRTLVLRDAETGAPIREFSGHGGTVYALDVMNDGGTLVSGALDGTARLWEVETGSEIARWSSRGPRVYAIAFVGDGRVLVGTDDGVVRIWRPPVAAAIPFLAPMPAQ